MIIKYIISIFLGSIISSTFLSLIFTIVRVGLPTCKYEINKKENSLYLKENMKIQRKRYFIALSIDISIFLIISILVFVFLNDTFVAYIVSLLFIAIISFKSTGSTVQNMNEFWNTYWNIERMGKISTNIDEDLKNGNK